jgi:hypothetical protein
LINKATQLESRLPFQSTMVQIPYENTLGGFAMFNTGVTDLAPELTGWYGTEAIDPKAATTVFLVGNHFSVHQTKVIAGGQNVGLATLLSRQVVQVTIPPKTLLVGDADHQFVDVQLATPYGVTQHLLIPALKQAPGASPSGGGPSENDVAWKAANVDLAFVYAGLGIAPPPSAADPRFRPPTLLLTKGTIDTTTYNEVDITLKFPGVPGAAAATIPGNVYDGSKGGYVVPGDKLANAVFGAVGAFIGPASTNPAVQITATASFKFKSSSQAGSESTGQVANDLTIDFIEAPAASDK